MKHNFLSIIVISVFCLTILPVHADNINDFSLQNNNLVNANTTLVSKQFDVERPSEKKLKAYPNPIIRGALMTIEMPGEHSELTIFLYNTVGKVVHSFKTSDSKVEFNAPDVSGIYLLRFVEKQKVIAVEKIVVKE